MAEDVQGISRTFRDVGAGVNELQRLQGLLRREVGRNVGNVGRYFTSQAPVKSAAELEAERRNFDYTQIPRTSATSRPSTGVGRRVQENREAVAARGTGGAGGAGGNPINALFAPMFADLKRQRQLANKRYEANRQQVTNIYGQITGARSEDIESTETAFKRLVDAASTRSQAVNTGIDEAEAARLQQNQAALQGMGLEGLSTSQGDIASQTAAQAQQTNTLNSANWENMLRAMGATAGQQVQADIAGYNYAMAEDLGQLRGAREEFAQELGQQRGQLRSQRAQATFEYQQAQQRAAASARAAQQRAAMQMASEAEKQAADALRASGPAMVTIDAYVKSEQMSPAEGAAALDAITEFYQNNTAPRGKWFSGEAKGVLFDAAGDKLTPAQKRAISAVFDQTLPKG
jgi:hypothetical protein